MLDVGFTEILLTSAIALIVLGPEKLPKVARQVGNWMGRARVMARQLSEQLEREVNAEELLKLQNKPTSAAPEPHDPVDRAPLLAPPTAPIPPPASTAEPVYGLDASQTTAAAMHAADPSPSDAPSAHTDPPAP
jgi:sec-independent protein translocase protein TatB